MDQTRTPDVMDIGELAERLNISLSHAYSLARADKLPLPTLRIGRRFYYSRDLYQKFLAGEYVKPTKKETSSE